jgi:hypothetical protein
VTSGKERQEPSWNRAIQLRARSIARKIDQTSVEPFTGATLGIAGILRGGTLSSTAMLIDWEAGYDPP